MRGHFPSSSWRLFGSGLLLGLAYVMKQHGVFFALFGGAWLAWTEWRRPERAWRRLLGRTAWFGLGVLLPFAATCLVLWQWGVFEKFWFWTFTYARAYNTIKSPFSGREAFLAGWQLAMRMNQPLWVIGGLGLVAGLWLKPLRQVGLVLAVFLAFSFAAVCPGFFFRNQYFILVLPALSLLIAQGIWGPGHALSGWKTSPCTASEVPAASARQPYQGRVVNSGLLMVFLVAYGVALGKNIWLNYAKPPLAVCPELYYMNPLVATREIGRRIRENSPPEARIAVLGSEPQIFFYAQRRSATGYIYVYPLMEPQPYALQMQEEMIREIEAASPEYIVYVNMPLSWLLQSNSLMRILEWADPYVYKHYQPVGYVGFPSFFAPVMIWGDEARKPVRAVPDFIYLYKRKEDSKGSNETGGLNPKSEIRNPKADRHPKSEARTRFGWGGWLPLLPVAKAVPTFFLAYCLLSLCWLVKDHVSPKRKAVWILGFFRTSALGFRIFPPRHVVCEAKISHDPA